MTAACLVNGAPERCVDAADRGFLYGDGLFETMLCIDGVVPLWDAHVTRLTEGCRSLGIPPPQAAALCADLAALTHPDRTGVLRIQVTAGCGGRGTARPATPEPTRCVTLHGLPGYPRSHWQHGITLHACEMRLSRQPRLAGLKHCNRLEYILARGEWSDPEIPDGLLLDEQGHVIEAIHCNTFAVRGDRLLTPALDACGVAGIMRARIIELAGQEGLQVDIGEFELSDWCGADEVFVCNSVIGAWPVRRIGASQIRSGPVTLRIQRLLKAQGLGLEGLMERVQ